VAAASLSFLCLNHIWYSRKTGYPEDLPFWNKQSLFKAKFYKQTKLYGTQTVSGPAGIDALKPDISV